MKYSDDGAEFFKNILFQVVALYMINFPTYGTQPL